MKALTPRLVLGLGLAVFVAVLDQATKWHVLDLMRPPGNPEPPFAGMGRIPVLPFADLVLTWNYGISFGVSNTAGPWNAIVFTALALVVCAYLVRLMAKAESRLVVAIQGLVVGGAVGNVIDRVRFGAVVDFIYVHIGAFDWWPVFNVADSAISVGAVMWILESLFGASTSHKNTP